jgi:IS4 transposase
MEIVNPTLKPKVQEAIETCDPLVGDDWERMCARIPVDVAQLAQETQALQRKREVKSALDLLRLVLAYSVCDWSLRMVGAWATVIGLGYLSDVAVRKRLRKTLVWLGRIIGTWLQQRQGQLAGRPVSLRLIDASTVSRPGSRGTDWRLHVRFDLETFSMTGVEVTDAHGGETLTRHPAQAGEINVADRGYAHPKGLGSFLVSLAYVVVRMHWQNLPLETVEGQKFDLLGWLKAETVPHPRETLVWVATPLGRFAVRLIAQHLPLAAAEAARRRLRRASRKKGHTPSQASLYAASYILLVTNLPARSWPAEQVLALYRLRWQVELLFKRLKSILDLDQLRAKEPVLAQVYLLGKLLGALLLEEWTGHLVTTDTTGWLENASRPLSLWRWMNLWTDLLRQAIRGPLTLMRCLAAWPRLARYLCDAPRKRRQQGALARQWLRAFGLAMPLVNPIDQHEIVLS